MKFCTAINCMDGRAQVPVIQYLKERFQADHVDMVTEAGVNRVLARGEDITAIESILNRVRISIQTHQSVGVAVIGHHDCAGNPEPEVRQNVDTMTAVRSVRTAFPGIPVIGLWLNEFREIIELLDGATADGIDSEEE